MLNKYFSLSVCVLTLFIQSNSLLAYQSVSVCEEKNGRIETLSTISNLAQKAIWLNDKELVVGRWDGTISIFQYESSLSIFQVLIPPKKAGITMLEKIDDTTFVSSNSQGSIAVWKRINKKFVLKNTYDFNPLYGCADSAKLVKKGEDLLLLTGFSEGFLFFLKLSDNYSLIDCMDLRSNFPVESPYKLNNIQSILLWKKGIVITASEDGDLCMVDIDERKVTHRQKYNEKAKRGINQIFILDDYLLLSNCTVGRSDRNLWLFRIEKNRFIYLDSLNLSQDHHSEQIFSFHVGGIQRDDKKHFFCTTEEGLLWFGQIKNERLCVTDFKKVSPWGGATLAMHPSNLFFASVSYDVLLLKFSVD